jgi:hypothetical protein
MCGGGGHAIACNHRLTVMLRKGRIRSQDMGSILQVDMGLRMKNEKKEKRKKAVVDAVRLVTWG